MSDHISRAGAIAIAEGLSSATALGSAWFMSKDGHDRLIQPARDFLAKHVISPCYRCAGIDESFKGTEEEKQKQLMVNSQQRAALLLKGMIMIGVGFATHIPTQMMLEGHMGEAEEFKQVVTGKSVGLVTTLVSLGLTEKMSPGIIEKVENKIVDSLGLEPKDPAEDKRNKTHDFRNLVFIEVPSSVVSGLVNYSITRKMAH